MKALILIVSKYYILCISWIIKCLLIIDARCKHEVAGMLTSDHESEICISLGQFF